MGGHKDRISHFEMIDGLLLERVQFEGVLMMQVNKKRVQRRKKRNLLCEPSLAPAHGS